MFLLWLLLALSMWSMLVTTKGRVVVNTLPFEFGLDAFIGRNCCKVLGPETLMILVSHSRTCHSSLSLCQCKKSIHSVNPLTVTRCHSKNISPRFFELFFLRTAQRQQQAFVGSGRVGGRLVTEAQVDLTTRKRDQGLRVVRQFSTQRRVRSREEAFLSDRDWRPTSCCVGPILGLWAAAAGRLWHISEFFAPHVTWGTSQADDYFYPFPISRISNVWKCKSWAHGPVRVRCCGSVMTHF